VARDENYEAIFAMPPWEISNRPIWLDTGNFLFAGHGVRRGGVALRMMNFTEGSSSGCRSAQGISPGHWRGRWA
jgi:hypothetical protein